MKGGSPSPPASRDPGPPFRLGHWACLGILAREPLHGFAVAARLRPEGDIGRVWSMSRALTYRCLRQLEERGAVRSVGEEPGIAGGPRTVLAPTEQGRTQLERWLTTPVAHLRDLRSELLLKVIIAERCGIDIAPMLSEQRDRVEEIADAITSDATPDPDAVTRWRLEAAQAALRFLDGLPRRH